MVSGGTLVGSGGFWCSSGGFWWGSCGFWLVLVGSGCYIVPAIGQPALRKTLGGKG